MVDEKKIAFRPAVEISYLKEDEQYTLLDAMQFNDCTPSLVQAISLKTIFFSSTIFNISDINSVSLIYLLTCSLLSLFSSAIISFLNLK